MIHVCRVASKTTQAIRRGFTKVRGEAGTSGSLMGIHRWSRNLRMFVDVEWCDGSSLINNHLYSRGKTLVKKLHQSEIALSTRDSAADRWGGGDKWTTNHCHVPCQLYVWSLIKTIAGPGCTGTPAQGIVWTSVTTKRGTVSPWCRPCPASPCTGWTPPPARVCSPEMDTFHPRHVSPAATRATSTTTSNISASRERRQLKHLPGLKTILQSNYLESSHVNTQIQIKAESDEPEHGEPQA